MAFLCHVCGVMTLTTPCFQLERVDNFGAILVFRTAPAFVCHVHVSLARGFEMKWINTSVVCFAARHRKIYTDDFRKFDVQKLFRRAVPPADIGWNQLWHTILHAWQRRIDQQFQYIRRIPWFQNMVSKIFQVLEIWKYIALLHDNRWAKRILHWNPGGGRPRRSFFQWQTSIHFFCCWHRLGDLLVRPLQLGLPVTVNIGRARQLASSSNSQWSMANRACPLGPCRVVITKRLESLSCVILPVACFPARHRSSHKTIYILMMFLNVVLSDRWAGGTASQYRMDITMAGNVFFRNLIGKRKCKPCCEMRLWHHKTLTYYFVLLLKQVLPSNPLNCTPERLLGQHTEVTFASRIPVFWFILIFNLYSNYSTFPCPLVDCTVRKCACCVR